MEDVTCILIHARETRLSARYLFNISMAQTELYNKSPYVIGARKWNSLSTDFQIPNRYVESQKAYLSVCNS